MIAPVLFIFFKRKETTLRVLREIKKAKPKILYIFQDGPQINSSFYEYFPKKR